jgi:hypothetical protein
MNVMIVSKILSPLILFIIILILAFGCRKKLPEIDGSNIPNIPPRKETLRIVNSLPPKASLEILSTKMIPIIKSINNSRATDLASIEMSLKILRGQPAIVTALVNFYDEIPDSNAWDRLTCVKILGAMERKDALPFLASLVNTPVEEEKKITVNFIRNAIRKRALRSIAYLQSEEADNEIISIIKSHPSIELKQEAIQAYIWNKDYSPNAIKSLENIVTKNLIKWLYMARYYKNMDPVGFDSKVRQWRRQWAEIKDPDSPIQTDDIVRERIGAPTRCNHDVLDSDRDIWPITHQIENFREWFAHQDVFNLQEDDWKSGWGYKQTNDDDVTFPFNKMLTASFVLTFGLEEMYLPCNATDFSCEEMWIGENVTTDYSNTDFRVLSPTAFMDSDGVLHVFAQRAHEGESQLIHYTYSPERVWDVENVSFVAPIVSAQAVYFSQPRALIENDGTIHVFVSTNLKDLIHYKKLYGGAWQVENVTQDMMAGNAPPFASNPVILRAPFGEDGLTASMQPVIHAFSTNKLSASSINPRRLVHYRLYPDGTWHAGKVLENTAPGLSQIIDINKCPNSDRFYLVTENFQGGITEFTWEKEGWTHESLYGADMVYPVFFRNYWIKRVVGVGMGRKGFVVWSKSISPDPIISTGPWASEIFFPDRDFWIASAIETYDISTAYPKLHVFATNFDAELIHFWRIQEGPWQEENLTERFGHHMWIPEVSKGTANTIHIFSDYASKLVHYYWTEQGGWKGEKYFGNVDISGKPVVVNTIGDEQHVLTYNTDFDLLHYSKRDLFELPGMHWPWHTRDYYAQSAHGADLYKHVPRETVPEGVAASQFGTGVTDQVEMSCLSFENHPDAIAETGAACRAAVMLHESVHQRYGDHFLGTGGMPHDANGDDWYEHGVFWGQLGIGLHSPIQLQAEFLSDMAEFPAGWVPFSVYSTAADEANTLINELIDNQQDPGWRCGDLRPFP